MSRGDDAFREVQMTLQDIWFVGNVFLVIVCVARLANFKQQRSELDRNSLMSRKWDIPIPEAGAARRGMVERPKHEDGSSHHTGEAHHLRRLQRVSAGMPDDDTLYANREEKYSRVVHCEINALIYAGTLDKHSQHTLYTVPFPSCDRCVVQMIQAGIQTFVAPEPTAEAIERWGTAFERTYKYIQECNRHIELIPVSELHVR
jgi:deoxycytidylate deaminase